MVSSLAAVSIAILKPPWASVTATVGLPFTDTVAPATGSLVSLLVTVPLSCLVWATAWEHIQPRKNSSSNVFVFLITLCIAQFLLYLLNIRLVLANHCYLLKKNIFSIVGINQKEICHKGIDSRKEEKEECTSSKVRRLKQLLFR
jgi:hypothetical protein